AEPLEMDRITHSKNLRPLQRSWLIKIEASDADGRSRLILLTSHIHVAALAQRLDLVTQAAESGH
ncbi:MAG: MarR family transcriptional regulator, partial [Casimicrobiaceae bacterium]